MVNNKINVNVIDGLQPILDRVVDYDNITNCITEIPQDIKLELNNGTLTLKAGSKVYIPNGKNADGSLKFDEVVSKNDISSSSSWTSGQVIMIPIKGLNSGIYSSQISNHYSGSTEPTTKYDGTIWYDTANNLIKRYNGSNSEWESGLPFPFCISTMTSGVGLTSIDQVFNGFGYIGSTVFALPGVKGLNPNGFENGAYSNRERILGSVAIYTNTNYVSESAFGFNGTQVMRWSNGYEEVDGLPDVTTVKSFRRFYVRPENKIYVTNNNTSWNQESSVFAGYLTMDSTAPYNITSLTPKLPFRAVDQNDFNKLDEEVATLDAQNVKLTGNQTIGGIKTFTVSQYAKSNNIDINTAPESVQYRVVTWGHDKNNVALGVEHFAHNTNGSLEHLIDVRRTIDGVSTSSFILAGLTSDGTKYAKISQTPPVSDNSTQIATTAFFRNNMQVVDALPSTATNGVFYFVRE